MEHGDYGAGGHRAWVLLRSIRMLVTVTHRTTPTPKAALATMPPVEVLTVSMTWLRMREEYGLDGAESGPLVICAVKVLEREIRAGRLPEPPC